MKEEKLHCDIKGHHRGDIKSRKVPVMFDHDQEDGKSRRPEYFEMKELEICEKHYKKTTIGRRIIYAYGAMGYNEYSL